MKRFKLSKFNINKIGSIIGQYDDLKNKDGNIFNGVKKFKKFKVSLNISPKEFKSYIVSANDHDIGDFCNNKVDIIPFLKGEELYLMIRDSRKLDVYGYVYLDKYYTNNDASTIIKAKIHHTEEDTKELEYVWEDTEQKLESIFITSKRFNYIRELEWIAD